VRDRLGAEISLALVSSGIQRPARREVVRRGAEKAAKIFPRNGAGPIHRRRGTTSRRTSSPVSWRPGRGAAGSRHRPRAFATILVPAREVWLSPQAGALP